jgi:hypothetical protein
MALFIPLASGIAAALTVALTYETGYSAKRKFDKKRARNTKDRASKA